MQEVHLPQKNIKNQSQLPFAVFILGIIILIIGYYHMMIFIKNQQIDTMSREIESFKKETTTLMTPEIKQLEKSQQWIGSLKQSNIEWSVFVQKLLSVLPKDVSIASITGDVKGKMTANLLTSSLHAVGQTIEKIGTSGLFEDVFVPSLSSGVSIDQNMIIHFPIVFNTVNRVVVKSSAESFSANNSNEQSGEGINTNQ